MIQITFLLCLSQFRRIYNFSFSLYQPINEYLAGKLKDSFD